MRTDMSNTSARGNAKPADNDSESQALDLKKVSQSIDELERAWQKKEDFKNAYNDAIDNIASKAGIRPDVLKAFVNARMRDKMSEHEAKAEQMQLLLDEVGID